jgi:3-phenylpropionate/cinnamic acid dioxygenase small subunit
MDNPAPAPTQVDLALRTRIEDFLNDLAQTIDDDALERWPEAFTEDGLN